MSPGAASITRRIRGHAHLVPIRHRFPQLPAANHRAVASRLQPLLTYLHHNTGYVLPGVCFRVTILRGQRSFALLSAISVRNILSTLCNCDRLVADIVGESRKVGDKSTTSQTSPREIFTQKLSTSRFVSIRGIWP